MLVSIIIPYFKSKNYLPAAISSVKLQTYKKWEIIIIDDENSDESRNFLKQFKKKNINIFVNKKNRGVSYSRNFAIKKSNGIFCAFLDSDDIWHKKKLEYQIKNFKKNPENKAFFSYYFAKKNKKIIYKVRPNRDYTFDDLEKENPICCSSVLLHKDIYKNYEFDEKLRTKEDYDLWLRISKKYKFKLVKYSLVGYSLRKNSLSSHHLDKIKNALYIYHTKQNYNLLYSFYCVVRLYVYAIKKKYLVK